MYKKKIIVSGATSGIGREVAKLLVQNGFYIIMLGRSSKRLLETQNQIDPARDSTCVVSCDLTRKESIAKTVQIISNEKKPIYGLVNAAGIGYFKTVINTSDEEIAETFSANIMGLIYLTKEISKLMIEEKSGQIVNVASMAGKITTPKAAIYGSSKAAVIAFSNGLRLELQPYHVKVSTINTGPVSTPFLLKADPSGRYKKSMNHFLIPSTLVAKKIALIFNKYKREVNLPWYMEGAAKLYPFWPNIGDYLTRVVFNKK